MSIAATGAIIHLPFGERPQYGSPYPEGIAVGHINQDGDATGGTFSMTFNADAGFLYRLEGIQLARGSATPIIVDMISSHRWASDKSGLGPSSFDLNWILGHDLTGNFAIYTPSGRGNASNASTKMGSFDLPMMRRLPIGRLDAVILQPILTFNLSANTNTITHELSVWLTYWRKESIIRPGFLSSFYESPSVPAVDIPVR